MPQIKFPTKCILQIYHILTLCCNCNTHIDICMHCQ